MRSLPRWWALLFALALSSCSTIRSIPLVEPDLVRPAQGGDAGSGAFVLAEPPSTSAPRFATVSGDSFVIYSAVDSRGRDAGPAQTRYRRGRFMDQVEIERFWTTNGEEVKFHGTARVVGNSIELISGGRPPHVLERGAPPQRRIVARSDVRQLQLSETDVVGTTVVVVLGSLALVGLAWAALAATAFSGPLI